MLHMSRLRQRVQQCFAIEENRLILYFWLGGLFAPLFAWFLFPYCVKQLKRLPIGDEVYPYVLLLMLMGISLSLWGALVAILYDVGVHC